MARLSSPRSSPLMALLLVSLLASLMITRPASAQQAQIDPVDLTNDGLIRLDSVAGGSLLFETDQPGWYVPAPVLHTDIDVAVSGPIARATVTQRFHNAADVFVEGKYVFPLPEGAAVDTLRMRVDDRWVEGSVEEREEARLIYEEAKEAGQVTSLVEQERPNMFTTSVANIAPDASVIIQIQYQESLAPRDGVFGLRVPLVVAPRYSPGEKVHEYLELSAEGWVGALTAPPLVDPRSGTGSIHNPVELTVDLDAGFPLGDIASPYHDINTDRRLENVADVQLSGTIPADRDFYLSWRPRELTEPYTAAFREHRDNDTHMIAMLTPPTASALGDTREPREVIFVQDTSGSMGGDSLVQAKAGLVMALERLTAQDTFNVIEFNSYFSLFAPEPVRASQRNIDRALAFVDDLVATNGTDMFPALEAALADTDPAGGRLRQVVFLTDGAVSNESQMLNLIETDLGDSRLFTVGIGSAPNSYFMTAAAQAGRGSFIFIGDIDEVTAQMQTLFAKIESPALVDLQVDGLPAGVEVSPSPLPDLYAGDPVVLTVRMPVGADVDSLRLIGRHGSEEWHTDVMLADANIRPGVSKLWARERIRSLEALRVSPEVDQAERERIDEDVLETALEFGLVSRLTSLVAVDVEVTRPPGTDSASTDVALNLPAGWDPTAFGLAADAETGASVVLSPEILERLTAADGARTTLLTGDRSLAFAATGGDWQRRALLGFVVIALGVAMHKPSHRRRL